MGVGEEPEWPRTEEEDSLGFPLLGFPHSLQEPDPSSMWLQEPHLLERVQTVGFVATRPLEAWRNWLKGLRCSGVFLHSDRLVSICIHSNPNGFTCSTQLQANCTLIASTPG